MFNFPIYPPQPRYLSSSSSLLAAQVQKPAPAFKAQAVVDGQFKEVSLEDYKVSFGGK